MRINLHSDTYYDFYKIRKITFIEDDKIIIEGNFGKGKRYKEVTLLTQMIDDQSYMKLRKYCRNNMDVLKYIGACPNCDSTDLLAVYKSIITKEVNTTKQKENTLKLYLMWYRCRKCRKKWQELDLKEVDIIVYF